ncbi:MAG: hypothetical protein P8124_12180 [Gammaproteobacteria bacterium]
MTCATSPVTTTLVGFCETLELEAEDTSSLELLQAVEGALSWLPRLRRKFRAFQHSAVGIAGTIAECERKQPLDPEGVLVRALNETEQRMQALIAEYVALKESAENDPELRGDHEELVVSEFVQTIETMVAFHNALVELRWAVLEHDADTEEHEPEAFESVEDLLESLKG